MFQREKPNILYIKCGLGKHTLQESVEIICRPNTSKPSTNALEILAKTCGENFNSSSYPQTYFDAKINETRPTKFSEFMAVLHVYDRKPDTMRKAEALLNTASLLFQRTVVELYFKQDTHYARAVSGIDAALKSSGDELEARDISRDYIYPAAQIKYEIRALLKIQKYYPKNTDFERSILISDLLIS